MTMVDRSPNYYDIGDRVHLTAKFSIGGIYTDPTAVVAKVKDPSGHIDVYTLALAQVTKDAVGKYSKDISIDEEGEWFYRWEGTGAVEAAEDSNLIAEVSEFF